MLLQIFLPYYLPCYGNLNKLQTSYRTSVLTKFFSAVVTNFLTNVIKLKPDPSMPQSTCPNEWLTWFCRIECSMMYIFNSRWRIGFSSRLPSWDFEPATWFMFSHNVKGRTKRRRRMGDRRAQWLTSLLFFILFRVLNNLALK